MPKSSFKKSPVGSSLRLEPTISEPTISHKIAWFISPHGFGHAARASAVMDAVHKIDPSVLFEIFTLVPPWFFQDSVSGISGYHSLLTDIGFVQKSPLCEDTDKTLQTLDEFLPFQADQIADLSGKLQKLKCNIVICDIAPMGIAVAREAHIPSVLVENFTWDWIYERYKELNIDGKVKKHTEYLRNLFESADYHIQAEPICLHKDSDLVTLPISRKIRTSRQIIRQRLGIPDDKKMVVITMGGIPESYNFLDKLAEYNDIFFVIPGAKDTPVGSSLRLEPTTRPLVQVSYLNQLVNIILLPSHSDFFHPDLINASDAVVGKVGYSTLAEIYHAGVPFGYILRPSFPESEKLAAFVKKKMQGYLIDEADFHNGRWVSSLEALFAMPWIQRDSLNGADQAAQFICNSCYALFTQQ